jgi:hypothetical protein
MTSFLRKLRWLSERRRKEDELRQELQFHLDEESEDRQAQGLAEQEARSAARRDLGNLMLIQERTRAMWTWTSLEQLVQDLRYGCARLTTPRIHNAGYAVAGPWNRGQHRDLQFRGFDPAAGAAGFESRIAGGAELAHQR